MAAGNGHIEFVGTNGGAGKYIRIKHLNGYKTSYSHLSKYVWYEKKPEGEAGTSYWLCRQHWFINGPHLHYEVIFSNERINHENEVTLRKDTRREFIR